MTTQEQFSIGQIVFQAAAEWIDGRPIDDIGEVRAAREEAEDDLITRIGWLSAGEQARVRDARVEAWRITTSLCDDGTIGGMISAHIPVPSHLK